MDDGMANPFWHVRNCSLFERLSETQLAKLEKQARSKRFPKGSCVYLPHDSAETAFVLVSGRIRIGTITPEGKHAILGFIEPGELFGELSIIDTSQREERAEAIADSMVVMLMSSTLNQMMDDSASLAISLTKLIGLRRRRLERRLKNLLFRSNRHRLIYLLLDLAQQYGCKHPNGISLGIRLSHQDLACLIGSTRESVTNTLGELQEQGFVQIERQRVVLTNISSMSDEVDLKVPEILTPPAGTILPRIAVMPN
jgi:CRP-like cAMP-binding protein